MATRRQNLLEKLAGHLGVLYRYNEPRFPRWKDTLIKIWHREMKPPTTKDWPQVKADFAKLDKYMMTGSYRQLTLREAIVYGAVLIEIVGWFFVGEIIGRRSLWGYITPATYIDPSAAKKMKKFQWDDKSELERKHDEPKKFATG